MVIGSHCTYTRLDSGLHKFVFMESSRQAVNEHVEQLENLYRMTASTDKLLIVIDLRPKGFPPMAYTFEALRKSNRQFANRPASKYAFLYNSGFLVSMAVTFFDLLNPSGSTARFFAGDKEAEAVTWLQEGK